MTQHTPVKRDRLRTLADCLGLEVSDEGVNTALDTADGLASSVSDSATVDERESLDRWLTIRTTLCSECTTNRASRPASGLSGARHSSSHA